MGDDVGMALPVRRDHCVIHVSDWDVSNAFYRDVVGVELVEAGGRLAYRFGAQQLNLHGRASRRHRWRGCPFNRGTATCASRDARLARRSCGDARAAPIATESSR